MKEATGLPVNSFLSIVRLHFGINPWLQGQTKISAFLLSVKSQTLSSPKPFHFQSPGGFYMRGVMTECNGLLQEG